MEMEMGYAEIAIKSVLNSEKSFCKFLSANDTGLTGGHQAGIYIPHNSFSILFEKSGVKGENKEKRVTISWQDGQKTESRFIYYGNGTRNEYRITRFGRNFNFLQGEFTGALFVLSKLSEEEFEAFVLNSDNEIEIFLAYFGISPVETNCLIDKEKRNESTEKDLIDSFIDSHSTEFPSTVEMAASARTIFNQAFYNDKSFLNNTDLLIISWIDMEYKIFRALEQFHYGSLINQGFQSVDDFLSLANMVLNRRKSRAGKSLELHLAEIFNRNQIEYSAQGITEGNKRPDFIFPSIEAYHNKNFPISKLNSLAAKTTCKDRCRQILNEADRLKDKEKFLFTLQQGISENQMEEMKREGVRLIVPLPYHKTYPSSKRSEIWSLERFLNFLK